jgi:uracil-DNA glycosylase
MAWSERQAAMLKEMGLRVAVRADVHSATLALSASPALGARAAVPRSETPPRPVAAPPPSVPLPVQIYAPRSVASAAVAAMDWPELRSAVASCTACKLCQGRTNIVFGVGHVNAHWMVVGEAPGEQEDAQGEPFVGKSGQLLDNMLRALGLSRDATQTDPSNCVYIANSVKCRPPGNRNPAPDELAECEPFLIRPLRGAKFIAQFRPHRQTSRPRSPLPRRATHRHLPPGLLAAQFGRKSACVG